MHILVALRPSNHKIKHGSKPVKLLLDESVKTITHVCKEASAVLGVNVDQCFDFFDGKFVHIMWFADVFPGATLFFVPLNDPSRFQFFSLEYMEATRRMLFAFRDLHPTKESAEQRRQSGEPQRLTVKELSMLEKLATDAEGKVDWQAVRLKMVVRLHTNASCSHLRRHWEYLKRESKGQTEGKKGHKVKRRTEREETKGDASDGSESEWDSDRENVTVIKTHAKVFVKEGGHYTGGWKFLCNQAHKHRPDKCSCVRHGFGILMLNKKPGDRISSTYKGEWVNNMEHGSGDKESSSLTYSGGWYKGKFHGRGELRYYHGDTFKGRFDKGWYHEGELHRPDGSSFNGRFAPKTNQPLEGLLVYPPGGPVASYEGSLRNGNVRYGKGTMVTTGKVVSGTFIDGNVEAKNAKLEWHGEATDNEETMEFEIGPGCSFEGDIDPTLLVPHGRGLFKASNGMTFRGQFVEGKPIEGALKWDGYVVLEDPLTDDANAEGMLASQFFGPVTPKFVPHGKGTFVFDDSVYKGDVCNGVLHGKGELHLLDESQKTHQYRGQFENGKFNHDTAEPPPPKIAPTVPSCSPFLAGFSVPSPSTSSSSSKPNKRSRRKKGSARIGYRKTKRNRLSNGLDAASNNGNLPDSEHDSENDPAMLHSSPITATSKSSSSTSLNSFDIVSIGSFNSTELRSLSP